MAVAQFGWISGFRPKLGKTRGLNLFQGTSSPGMCGLRVRLWVLDLFELGVENMLEEWF